MGERAAGCRSLRVLVFPVWYHGRAADGGHKADPQRPAEPTPGGYRRSIGPGTVVSVLPTRRRQEHMIRSESTDCSSSDDVLVSEAVQRLEREFRGSIHRGVIAGVVRRSRHELDSPSAGALPELVERLARQRLLQHVTAN